MATFSILNREIRIPNAAVPPGEWLFVGVSEIQRVQQIRNDNFRLGLDHFTSCRTMNKAILEEGANMLYGFRM